MQLPGRPELPSPARALEALVAAHFEGHPFVRPGRTVVAAVSGGPDSAALLDLLAGLARRGRLAVVVAHLDHGLRQEASVEDARFVTRLAAQHGFVFHCGHEDVAALARREKRSIEDAARSARRRFLEMIAAKTDAAAIALGHTRDDQAETLLLNLIRGAGPRGLAAMPEYGPGLITRPLIKASREQIEAFLGARGLAWRDDATNLNVDLTRNRVRHELLPLLRERFNAAATEVLARQADLFGEIDQLLAGLAEAFLADPASAEPGDGTVRIDAARLAAQPPALRRAILRLAARNLSGSLADWGRSHLDALLELIGRTEPAHLDLPGGIAADMEAGVLELAAAGRAGQRGVPGRARPGGAGPDGASMAPVHLSIRHGAETAWGAGWIRVLLLASETRSTAATPPDGARSAWFDAADLGPELLVRTARHGDRLRPFGGGGRRLVSDILSERGVPGAARAAVPLVIRGRPGAGAGAEPEGEIAWIPGLCRSNAAPVTAATRAIAGLEWFGPAPGEK